MNDRLELLTANDVCRILNVQRTWIAARVHSGTLPFSYLKVGRYLRFPRDAVETYIRGGIHPPKVIRGGAT